MLRKLLRAKLHRATVTRCDPDYVGSITIDSELLRASGIRPNEAVSVFDIDNAARFDTYVIAGPPGSGEMAINGAAAKLVDVGHRIIVVCFGYLEPQELDRHWANVLVLDERNRVRQRLTYESLLAPAEPSAIA